MTDVAAAPTRLILPLVVTLVIQVMSSLIALSVPVLAPAIAQDRGLDPTLVGFYPGLMYSAALASCLFVQPLLGRFGPLRLSLMCIAASALGLAVLLAPAVALLAPGALVIGTGYGPVVPASSQILVGRTPPSIANLVFSLKQTGAPLGGLLAGTLLPMLVGIASWQTAALTVIAVSIGIAAALALFIPALDGTEASAGATPGLLGPIRGLFAVRALRSLVLATLTFSAMQLCLGAFLTVYFVERVGLTLVDAGLLFGASQAGSIVGRIAWGALADRFLPAPKTLLVLGLGMSIAAVSVGTVTLHWPFWSMALLCTLWGATAMAWNGVLLSEVARQSPPGQAGSFTSAAMMFNFAGVLIGPLLFSTVLRITGQFFAAFVAIAAFTLAGSVPLLVRVVHGNRS